MSRFAVFTVCLALALGATAQLAQADGITSADGVQVSYLGTGPVTVPDSGTVNDIVGNVSGYFGATLSLDLPSGLNFSSIEYIFEGKEAGYNNRFEVYNGTSWVVAFTNDGSSAGDNWISTDETHALSFRFWSPEGTAANGSNVDDRADGAVNFAIAYIASGNNPLNVGWSGWTLLWDDSGSSGTGRIPPDPNVSDDNHDDMVVRVVVHTTPVPEPATLALMGLGIVGIAAGRRRRAGKA